jgi:hypothetical protein
METRHKLSNLKEFDSILHHGFNPHTTIKESLFNSYILIEEFDTLQEISLEELKTMEEIITSLRRIFRILLKKNAF